MTQSGVGRVPGGSGDIETHGEKRSTRLARGRSVTAARRRWAMLFAVVAVTVAAILANIGPLTHYEEASVRLDKATAKVDALEAQEAELQAQVARLSESGYLETLAREQLTYVRPGEELYIVTQPPGDSDANAGVAGSDSASATTGEGAGATEEFSSSHSPGFLERAISAIRDFF
jgi:cell division protein FtsB